MDLFDECSVLIPSATLEDFPAGGSDGDARSLLAGWTVLWHPKLLAQTAQVPTWYRADSPPTPDGPRVIVVPEPSIEQLPSDYRRKCDANPACRWVTGADRQAMLAALELDLSDSACKDLVLEDSPGSDSEGSDSEGSDSPGSDSEGSDDADGEPRTIGVQDFFAAGYLALQIQIMTRRLRYTSNLDELYLQNQIVSAAKAFLARDASTAAEALHDVFDCLAEERDHYFSSDPHLVDLTLLTPSVLEKSLASGWLDRLQASATVDNESHGILGTPRNLLIDGPVAAMLVDTTREQSGKQQLRELLQSPSVGWAGGGPAETSVHDCLDAMTLSQGCRGFQDGWNLAKEAVGQPPLVYARLDELTPADLIPTLSRLGYQGVIPINFVRGEGFGDEAKVVLSNGDTEIEALTAKPIDASSDSAFLDFGAVVGEAIDTGEIATGLLVHWPDQECDSFHDLSRAASWCVALGKFWTLEKYFSDGERPFHNGSLKSVSASAATQFLSQLKSESISGKSPGGESTGKTAIQSFAERFCDEVKAETRRTSLAIARLAKPKLLDDSASAESTEQPTCTQAILDDAICDLLAVTAIDPSAAKQASATSELVCLNPHSSAIRITEPIAGGAPKSESYVFSTTGNRDGTCDVTFDATALGMVRLAATQSIPRTSLLKRLTGRAKGIAENLSLRNEFMAVSISPDTGGIEGVYSASRGNRLSMRLVFTNGRNKAAGAEIGEMISEQTSIIESSQSMGTIRSAGRIVGPEKELLAKFELEMSLRRGSRLLQIRGTLTPEPLDQKPTDNEKPTENLSPKLENYFAVRSAVAGEAPIIRPLVRDKIHTARSRNLVAPLGVLIDEAEKQTLIASHGLPLHRKVDERFLDTVVALPSGTPQGTQQFELTYGLDILQPIATARACISPPRVIAAHRAGKQSDRANQKSEQAWLMHISPKDLVVVDMQTQRRKDGKLAARLSLVMSRSKSAKARLQFCNFPVAAFIADQHGIDRPLDDLPSTVQCDDGVVTLSVDGHQAIDLVVVFDI